MDRELFETNVDFHADLVRNIPGIRASQDLFDDLSSEPTDWEIAIAAEGTDRMPTAAALPGAEANSADSLIAGGIKL